MVHIASLLGIPTIGIYTADNWNKNRWLPHGVPHRTVQSNDRESLVGVRMKNMFAEIDALWKEIT
ncbi:hypothetical protein DRQ33_06190 [bacterium]|nr:MAG: hypothetical protein DRQ33_06190 [bacterium]